MQARPVGYNDANLMIIPAGKETTLPDRKTSLIVSLPVDAGAGGCVYAYLHDKDRHAL